MSEIFFRISLTRDRKLRFKSGVFIKASRFKDGEIVKPRANQKEIAALRRVENDLAALEGRILDFLLTVNPATVPREDIGEIIERFHHPESFDEDEEDVRHSRSFFDLWEEFLASGRLSARRVEIYRSLARTLHRYECHRRLTREDAFVLDVESVTAEDLSDFDRFYREEWRIYDEYPEIYLKYPAELRTHHKTHRPQRRGDNSTVVIMKMLRAFFNWCLSQGITSNRPFDRYVGKKTEKYGTPYYLTLEERDHLAGFDFSSRPALAAQRDIFIFQCLIGCRVSDLMRLKKTNVSGGVVSYVAEKTKKERTETIRVPLNARACEILARYESLPGDELLPFISPQRYNDAIKEMCSLAGIDRKVMVINPTTGENEMRPICELASSHMARRTFIGNLYKKVKDASLVGSLSGHKEGSRSFARYREIDDDIKQELVSLLD